MCNYVIRCFILYFILIFFLFLNISCEKGVQTAICTPTNTHAERSSDSNSESPNSLIANTNPKKIDFYLDVSLSMKGFVVNSKKKKTRQNHYELDSELNEIKIFENIDYHYIKFLNVLPAICPIITGDSGNVSYSKFGTSIVSMDTQQIYKAARPVKCFNKVACPSFYDTCVRGKCLYRESHIGEVLNLAIEKDDESLSIILTDLFLMKEQISGETSEVCRPLIQAINNGKSVGILGIKSHFTGRVYDLPIDKPSYYDLDGSRPFFVLMIGKTEHILKFYNKIKKQVFEGVPQDIFNFYIFTSDLFNSKAITMETFNKLDKIEFYNGKETYQLIKNMPSYQQFIINRSKKGFNLSLDISKIQRPFTLPVTKFKEKKDFWLHNYKRTSNEQLCKQGWIPLKPDIIPVEVIWEEQSLNIMVFKSTSSLPSNKTYFLSMALEIEDIGFDTQTKKWLSEWSFDASQQFDLLAKQPDFFPTLNLKQLYLILSDVVKENIKNKQVGVLNMAFRKR